MPAPASGVRTGQPTVDLREGDQLFDDLVKLALDLARPLQVLLHRKHRYRIA